MLGVVCLSEERFEKCSFIVERQSQLDLTTLSLSLQILRLLLISKVWLVKLQRFFDQNKHSMYFCLHVRPFRCLRMDTSGGNRCTYGL